MASKTIAKMGNKVWKIAAHPLYREVSIDWLSFLPFEWGGTKHQREYLRRSSKEYFFAWICLSESKYGALSPGTVLLTFRMLKCICRWMTANEIWRYSQLTEDDINQFVVWRFKEVSSRESRAGRPLTNRTIKKYLSIFDAMWILRDQYTASIRIDVNGSERLLNLENIGSDVRRWRPLDQLLVVPLLKEALRWQESYEDLISLSDSIWHVRQKLVGTKSHDYDRAIKKGFLELSESKSGKFVREFLGAYEEPFFAVFAEAVRYAIGSALLILLFFTGMRISEVLSLEINCIEKRVHSDGNEYWYIRGISCKKKGRSRLWIVPEPVLAVISFIQSFYKDVRKKHEVNSLFLARRGGSAVLTGLRKPSQIGSGSANKLMRFFISRSPEAEIAKISEDFHAHRARKTFACFIALRDKSSLESLAHHYGHLYVGVLDQAYVGNDFELKELMREEHQLELRKGLTSLLTSSTLGGKAGEKLVTFQKEYQANVEFKGHVVLETMVDKLIDDGVVLAPCDWGYCLYAKDLSLCGGNDVGPSQINRAPSICASCSNFAVTDHHLPWWEKRYSEQDRFLSRDDLSAQTRRVVEQQIALSENILKRLIRSNDT